jgi:hypothetical protein
MNARFPKLALAASGVCVFAVPATQGAVVYRETFGRPDPATGNVGPQNFDWHRWTAAGTLGGTTSGVSSDGVGKPTDLANTASAGPNIDDTFNAYAEGWSYQDGTQRLSATTEFTLDPADYEPGSVVFSWYQGAAQITGVDQNAKLVVRVGGAWYASVENETNPAVTSGANFGSTDPLIAQGAVPVSQTYNPAAANWLTLTFDGHYDPATNTGTASTVALSLGAAPAGDLAGPITAFGIYRDATGANMRFDTFQIDAVPIPEPADLAGAFAAGCVALLLRRRTRRATV